MSCHVGEAHGFCNKILDAETVGFADVATHAPMRLDSIGYVASAGKPIIAAAIMMLVDEGKIELDAAVSNYLRDFAPRIRYEDGNHLGELRAPLRSINVRMLLDNTSGLQGDVSANARLYDSMPLDALVRDVVSRPLAHEPGSKFMYSGIGDSVAARVVEVVSGENIERFLGRRIFAPLGMKDTTFIPTSAELTRLATSYWTPLGAQQMAVAPLAMLTRPLDDRTLRYAPSGGLFSTAPDLSRFAQLFLNRGLFDGKRLLSTASIDLMTHRSLSDEAQATVPQIPGENAVFSYGLGWGVTDDGAYFHPGLGGSDMAIEHTRHMAVVLMSQSGTDAVFQVRSAVTGLANQLFLEPQAGAKR